MACNAAQTGQQTEAPQALKQTVRDKNISINFCRMLEMRHVSRKKFDESISTRGFELYLKAIDPSKIYFMQSDVDEFDAAFARTMAQSAKKGDLTPAYVIYNRFLQRVDVDERCATARALLEKNEFDFTKDETFQRDKKLLKYPATDAEAADRMRKRVKFELLTFEAEERDKEKEAAEKGEEVVKEQTLDGRADDPVSKLMRRYSTLQKRLRQTSNDDVLEIYLTAIANANVFGVSLYDDNKRLLALRHLKITFKKECRIARLNEILRVYKDIISLVKIFEDLLKLICRKVKARLT